VLFFSDVNGPGVPHWPQYDTSTQQYALIDLNVTIETKLYEDRTQFWLARMTPHSDETSGSNNVSSFNILFLLVIYINNAILL
jgi:hypothetical protein